jgi:hypothetical protein
LAVIYHWQQQQKRCTFPRPGSLQREKKILGNPPPAANRALKSQKKKPTQRVLPPFRKKNKLTASE